MKPIAIFFHTVFVKDTGEPFPMAVPIVMEQMQAMKDSGLLASVSYFVVGVNGGEESYSIVNTIFPPHVVRAYHGKECKAENLTIVELEKWVKDHPGWNILYLHSKGASHAPEEPYSVNVSTPWRHGMMKHLVTNWRACVAALEAGHDIAAAHWMWSMADGSQHIPAGNFLWLTSDFARKLPSIFLRERIRTSGIAALESRYEAEVYWGNGPRPNVKQFAPNGGDGIP